MSAVAASCLLMMSALFTSGAFGKGFMHANVLNSECVDVVYSLSLCVCVCVCVIYQDGAGWVEGEIYQNGGEVCVCLCMLTCAAGLCGVVKNSYIISLVVHCLFSVPV